MYLIRVEILKGDGDRDICERYMVEVTEEEVLELALEKVKERAGWTKDDISGYTTAAIIPL